MNSKEKKRVKALERLNQYGAEPGGQWLVRLFLALVPRETRRLMPIGEDGVIAFVPLTDVVATDRKDVGEKLVISIHLYRVDDGSFFLTAEVSDGCSGPIRNLFVITAQLHPPIGFHMATMVGQVKVGRTLAVGHTLIFREQYLEDEYSRWLMETAIPAIMKHCLNTARLFAGT